MKCLKFLYHEQELLNLGGIYYKYPVWFWFAQIRMNFLMIIYFKAAIKMFKEQLFNFIRKSYFLCRPGTKQNQSITCNE